MQYLLLILITWNLTNDVVSALPNAVRKKVDKTLAAQFPEASIRLDQLAITSDDQDLAYFAGDFHLLKVMNGNTLEGYMSISDTRGKFEYFTYMTLFNKDLSIRKVQLLLYREDYGSEIGNKRWLSQFEDKTNASDIRFEHEVRNISGATISCKSITKSLQQLIEGMKRLKKANKI